MPQRRFKFKLCRLARGERSLDSLPIIQLLLPSPSLFLFLPLLFILFRLSAVYLLRSSLARVNCRLLSFFLSSLPLWKFSRKTFTHFLYIYVCALSSVRSIFLCFVFTYRWLEDFFFFFFQLSSSFVCSRFFFLGRGGGLQMKSRAPYSPRRQPTVAAVWCFVCVRCRFSCSLWAWCEREAEECVIPQSACCFRCAFSFMWDLEIVW